MIEDRLSFRASYWGMKFWQYSYKCYRRSSQMWDSRGRLSSLGPLSDDSVPSRFQRRSSSLLHTVIENFEAFQVTVASTAAKVEFLPVDKHKTHPFCFAQSTSLNERGFQSAAGFRVWTMAEVLSSTELRLRGSDQYPGQYTRIQLSNGRSGNTYQKLRKNEKILCAVWDNNNNNTTIPYHTIPMITAIVLR